MNYLLLVFQGFIIGIGAILPGISSGAICVSFGMYEKLLKSITAFFKDIKENVKFLFPITFGVCIGIILSSNILKFLFNNYSSSVKTCFAILIVCSIPHILKNAHIEIFKLNYILTFFLSISISIYLTVLEKYGMALSNSESSFIFLFITGLIMSFGVVVPGVSSTVILMLLGKYDAYLSAISSLDFYILFPMGLGLLLGCFILMHLIKYLFRKFKAYTYFAIIGFVIGSLPILL